MLTKKFLYIIIMAMLTGIFILDGSATAAENPTTNNQLPAPAWQITLKSQLEGFPQAPYHVPNTNTVYVNSTTSVASETKIWSVGVVSAVDKASGKEKWSYSFYKKGMAYPWNTSITYNKLGTVYALVTDGRGTKLYSVNSAGKLNWMIAVPQSTDIHAMNDGTLLLINPNKQNSNGTFSPWAYAYSSKGKKLGERPLGEIYTILDGKYLVSQIGDLDKFKLQVYGPTLNTLFTYTPPTGAVTYIDEAAWVINGGDILIRVSLPQTGSRLIAVNAKGKTFWGRNIAGNASVQSTGQNYVVYENGEMAVYGIKGLLLKKTMQLSDPMYVISRSPDNKIMTFSEDWKSIYDPASLKTIYQIPFNTEALEYHYAGDGYLYAVKDYYQLLQYKLPKIAE